MKFVEKTRGAVSIFLIMIMLPMFVLAGGAVDGSRIHSAKVAITGAGDLAMNAALADYETVLKDVYGLFAMSKTVDELEENVSRYFKSTLENASMLDSGSQYTQGMINSIISSAFVDGDAPTATQNVLRTTVDSISLIAMNNSMLANPDVLERQIVEYMKIRGPVSLGKGLLTKLGCLGETSKQTTALKAKVAYEKDLSSLQEACETAYNAITSYKTELAASKYNVATDTYMNNYKSAFSTAKSKLKEMTGYILGIQSPFVLSTIYLTPTDPVLYKLLLFKSDWAYLNINTSIDKNYTFIQKPEENVYNTLRSGLSPNGAAITDDSKISAMEWIVKQLYEPYYNSLFSQACAISSEYSNRSTSLSTLENYIDFLADYVQDDGDKMVKAHYLMVEYCRLYEELPDSRRSDKISVTSGANNQQTEYALSSIYSTYTLVIPTLIATDSYGAVIVPNQMTGKANSAGKAACDTMYPYYQHLEEMITALGDSVEALDTVITKAAELDVLRQDWGTKVGQLSDSEIKSGMNSDYQNSARDVNEAAVNELKEKLNQNKNHLTKIKEKLETIKYYDYLICSDSTNVNYWSTFTYKVDKHLPPANLSNAYDKIVEISGDCLEEHFEPSDDTITFDANATELTTIDSTLEFYKYLQNTCTHGDVDESQQQAAEGDRDSLVSQGSTQPEPESNDYPTGSFLDAGLTPEIQEAIRSIAQGVDAGGGNTFSAEQPASSDENDMADAGSNNLDAVGSLLSSLGDIAEYARDYVYLEEYMTEMFSCGTTGKKNMSTLSLSGDDMSQNPRYGSEVEYLLYGFDTSDGNLLAARGTILGIRFALNCIFALTNSYTRTPALTAATAIAGWTGFGVPLVQTVILIAWALAESIVDVIDLCNGESVVVYKSSSTWVCGINGLKDKAIEWGEQAVGAAFDWVQNLAMDQIDQLEGKVEQYITETVNGVKESVEGAIVTTLEGLIVQVVGETNYNLTEADIGQRLDTALADARSNIVQDGSAAALALDAAFDYLQTGTLVDDNGATVSARDYLASKLYGYYTSAKEGVMAQISSSVDAVMSKISGALTDKINSAISSFGEELKGKVSDIISEGGDLVKEKVSGAIGNYMSDMSGIEMPTAETPGASGKTSLAASFSLSYKEYLKTFMMLGLIGNKTNILARCADLIQLNVSSRPGADGFNITEALTMVGIDASIKVKTSFLDVPVSTGVDSFGNTTYGLDFTKLGTGERIIHYKGIMGY
ncbi:MAG: Tad domain-containing protein [Lachnospiraceae bacterium]|nr:Tad domain-containing protein [Lachnospiraceae bacterium]